MNNRRIKALTLSVMFLAVGQILPFGTGQITTIGAMLLPMYLPILFLIPIIVKSLDKYIIL